MDKAYNPEKFEDKIYQLWEKSGYFNPDNLLCDSSAPSYTIILPPPNITDKLHLGHVVMLAIEDLLIRWHRQLGERALWVPGTDHAAIATQNVVEKKILQATGQTRHQLGRPKFLQEVNTFVAETQAVILNQIKKMGASLDWSRLAFTLDDARQRAVRHLFIEMYQAGVIYRGERIVNWCPRCQSTLADDEVEHQEQTTKLYTFLYHPDLPIAISTTRPETKLGDTAIAVNPKDSRYQSYLNKNYHINFVGQDLNLTVIADYSVDWQFGTGALGVTPAHSLIDWQIAEKNNLPVIKVIDETAHIHPGFGDYSGLSTLAARKKIIANLQAAKLLVKEEEITNNLSVCYRCATAIEPLPSKQWFISVDQPLDKLGGKSLKQVALDKGQTEEIQFIPQRFKQRYLDWMENLHDWCISRQIWFGHQIPAWYRNDEIYVGREAPTGEGWQADSDTLDTWFSSGMWTFSILGWPDNYQANKKSGDLAKFHPTQVLETGYEILTLWVSRMIMMSLFALGEIPFNQVYLHGMILDVQGKKMSKSKGNGVDPLELVAEYGADAVRLAVLTGSTPGNDSRYNPEKIQAKRNFINKLWNISRFIISLSDNQQISEQIPHPQSLADNWILQRFIEVTNNTNKRLTNYEFSLAADELLDFTWHDLADWYLEIAKIEKNKEAILQYLLKGLLRLWHPFIPFVTEAIWQSWQTDLLMIAPWPSEEELKKIEKNLNIPQAINQFSLVKDLIITIRDARSSHQVEPAKKIDALIIAGEQASLLQKQVTVISGLKTGLQNLKIISTGKAPGEAIFATTSGLDIYLSGLIDLDKEKERLTKEQEKINKLLLGIKNKLNNQEFVKRAPQPVVEAEKKKLLDWQAELERLALKLKDLS